MRKVRNLDEAVYISHSVYTFKKKRYESKYPCFFIKKI